MPVAKATKNIGITIVKILRDTQYEKNNMAIFAANVSKKPKVKMAFLLNFTKAARQIVEPIKNVNQQKARYNQMLWLNSVNEFELGMVQKH